MDVKSIALAAIKAGLAPIPIRAGGKVPLDKWIADQHHPMAVADLDRRFRNECNLGIACGAGSGNLECLDFDDAKLFQPFLDTLESVNPTLRAKLTSWQETPSGGYHILCRCSEPVGGNSVLARNQEGKAAIETRGQGGQFLIAPSMAKSKQDGELRPYILHGDLDAIPTISPEDRELLHGIARSFDENDQQEQPRQDGNRARPPLGERPGDRFNRETDWSALLSGYGWRCLKTVADRQHWQRPGKTGPEISATLRFDIEAGFWSFTTSTPLPPQKPLSKFTIYAFYEHGGDFHSAARALAGRTKTGTTTEDWQQQGDQGTRGEQNKQLTRPSFDPAKALEAFEVTREYVEKLGKERFLYPNLIIAQHILTVIAESGGGKTTFFFNVVAPNLARQGLRVFYIDADSPPSEHPRMKNTADANGFRFLNPDANQGTSVEGLLAILKQASESDTDLTDWVFFIDTLKKVADLLQKNSVKTFFTMCRKLAARGASVVLLGHANKYRDTAGQLVFEGVGDVKSDSDELIIFERQPNQSGGINVTTVVDPTKGAKVRGIFSPFSFHISREREVTFYEQPLVIPDRSISATVRATDDEMLGAAERYLREIGEPVLQRQLVERVCDVTGAASKRVRKMLVQHSEPKVDGQQQGLRFVYTTGDRNAHFYELPN